MQTFAGEQIFVIGEPAGPIGAGFLPRPFSDPDSICRRQLPLSQRRPRPRHPDRPFYGLHFIATVGNTTAFSSAQKSTKDRHDAKSFVLFLTSLLLGFGGTHRPGAGRPGCHHPQPAGVGDRQGHSPPILPLPIDAHSKACRGISSLTISAICKSADNQLACRLQSGRQQSRLCHRNRRA